MNSMSRLSFQRDMEAIEKLKTSLPTQWKKYHANLGQIVYN